MFIDRIGEICDVLICEKATDGRHFVGHNDFYEHILVPPTGNDLLGQRIRVKIVEVSKFYMKSIILDECSSNKEMSTSKSNVLKPIGINLKHITIIFSISYIVLFFVKCLLRIFKIM